MTDSNIPANDTAPVSMAEVLTNGTSRLEWAIIDRSEDDIIAWEATHQTGFKVTAPTFWQLMAEINQFDAQLKNRLPYVTETVIFWCECFAEDASVFALTDVRDALIGLSENEALDWVADNLGLQALSDIVGRVDEQVAAA